MEEENIGGPGWEMIRPRPTRSKDSWVSIDSWVPDAPWFWGSLQRHCVPDCCGLDAYDFSAESVRWACGAGDEAPAGSDWRDDAPGDPAQLAIELREAAGTIRAIEAEAVSGSLFNDILSPESYAQLFIELATTLETIRS